MSHREVVGGWNDARRLLAVRLDSIGDVLMTTPALRALKQARPGRSVTLLTSSAGAEVARLVPEIDEVWVYDPPWMKAQGARRGEAPEVDLEMIDRLRGGRFDAAAIFTVYSQNPLPAAMLCHLAGIPLRLAHCHENPYRLLTDWVPDPEPAEGIRHEVRRQLDLVATVGATADDEHLSIAAGPAAREAASRLLHERGIDGSRPWAVVHPGATAPSRRYAPDAFACVLERLAAHGWQFVLTGSEAERDLVDWIAGTSGTPARAVASRVTLEELTALLEQAPMLIANNTGPVHVAAALGTPVVDLYALTNPQHTPWQTPHRVLSHDVPCRNCYRSVCPEGHHDCLRLVTPDEVVASVLDLYEETQGAGTSASVRGGVEMLDVLEAPR